VRRFQSAAALGLLVAGCGYTLVGRGGSVDPSIKRIGVPLFKDSSGKPGLDQKITQRVVEELLKRGGFAVVQEAAGVDAVVDGTITAYNAIPVGFSGTGGQATQASRYAILVTARIRYAKLGAREAIWESDAFTFRDEYDIGDAATFFDREEQAIDRLSESFARSLVAAMLEAF
jgi:hypothetical protein